MTTAPLRGQRMVLTIISATSRGSFVQEPVIVLIRAPGT